MAAPTTTRRAAQPQRRPRGRELPFPLNIYQTAVGKKWAMAVTGLMLLGFVLFHMLGNLKIFIGEVEHNGVMEQDINIYGEFLRELLVPLFPRTWFLWLLRFGLIGAFGLHIHAAYSLTRMNQAANVRYENKQDWLASNFASQTMRYSGVIVLLYLVWHLADLTWGWSPFYDYIRGDIHHNLTESLGDWFMALIYIVANAALALHIFHGAWSLFQSLGINNPRYNAARRYFAAGFAALIFVGNVSIVVAVLADLV